MRQPHKVVKHHQTIRRQQLTNCLSVFDHFVGLAHKGLRTLDGFMNLIQALQPFQTCAAVLFHLKTEKSVVF